MKSGTEKTKQIIQSYHHAWVSGDLNTAKSYLADDPDFQVSIDRFSKADDLIDALSRFLQMVTGLKTIHELYSEDHGFILYDVPTNTPAGIIRSAEFLTVGGGRIRINQASF